MKFTLSWLKDHLDTRSDAGEIAETLTKIGLEVEGVSDPAASFAAFLVAQIVSAEKHPDADKLKVCMVDTGTERVQVVCGAPNARAGMKGVFAPVGTYVPGIDTTLTRAKIRGVESHGMLVSERELELSTEHTGIIELPENAEIGSPAAAALGLDDAVFEIGVTPNRPDCLGVRGIARDLSAASIGSLKPDPVKPVKGSFPCPVPIALRFDDKTADACPIFAGRVIRGLKNGPSPDWLQKWLKAIGLRPINALVDVTNYISYDRARPLHVYDADKLEGTICARLGQGGESFLGLDGKTYAVDENMCVIADDRAVLGLGGVMGGEETGATDATADVFIESAWFDPARTAVTGRTLNIHSDARHRFERGVDPASTLPGLELATRMILDICGGEASDIMVAGAVPDAREAFPFESALIRKRAGLEISEPEVKTILQALGLTLVGRDGRYMAAAPSWRPDISMAEDLVEEVVRIAGLDRVPATPMRRMGTGGRGVLTAAQKRQRIARRVLAGRGMLEAVTWSFVPKPHAALFGGGDPSLALDNPISTELSQMRPGLIAGLSSAAQRNRDRGIADGALFELGQAYRGATPEDQYMAVAGLRFGSAGLAGSGRHWRGVANPVGIHDAKADALALLAALGVGANAFQNVPNAPAWFHPGRSGTIRQGPKTVIGHFGELHPATAEALGLDGPTAAFEIDLDALPQPKRASATRAGLDASDLLPLRRDFAFLVDRDTLAGDVMRAARSVDKALIACVDIFDLFEGHGVPEGKKSLGLEVTLQPRDKTLTDSEIEAISAKIVAAVRKATGAELRS